MPPVSISDKVPRYTVEIVRDYAPFLSMEKAWNHLLSESHNPCIFMRHEWFRIFWKHFLGESGQAAIYVVKREETLVAIAPFWPDPARTAGVVAPLAGVVSPARGEAPLFSMTNDHSWHYEILYKEEAALSSLLDNWTRSGTARSFQLDLVPLASPTVEGIRKWATGRYFSWYAYKTNTPPYLLIQGRFADYFARRRGNFRSNVNRRERNLKKQGTISLETVTSLEDLSQALQDAFRLEAMAWKGAMGSAIEKSPQLVAFYTELAEDAAKAGWLRLYFLKLNDKRIAFNYNLAYQGKLYLLKPGYDPEYADYSPGHLITKKIIEQAFEEPLAEYNFLANAEPWKMDWAEGTQTDISLHLYRKGLSPGMAFFFKFGWKKLIKRYWKRQKDPCGPLMTS